MIRSASSNESLTFASMMYSKKTLCCRRDLFARSSLLLLLQLPPPPPLLLLLNLSRITPNKSSNGYFRLIGMIQFLISFVVAFNDTANMQSDSSKNRSIPGINPLVDTVTLFLLKFNPFGSVMIFTAFRTFSVLCNGSPIPMNTTFVTSSPAISLALTTCCTI